MQPLSRCLLLFLGLSFALASPALGAWERDTGNGFEMGFEVNDAQTHELAFFCAPGGVRGAYLGIKVPAGTQPPAISTITFQAPNVQTFQSPARVSREANGWIYVYFDEARQRIDQLLVAAEHANPTISVSLLLTNGQTLPAVQFSARGSDRALDRYADRCRDRFGR